MKQFMVKRWREIAIWSALIIAITVIAILLFTQMARQRQELPATDRSSRDPISENYPLFVGSTWTYTFEYSTEASDGNPDFVHAAGSYTESVLQVENSPFQDFHIYRVELTGEILDMDCSFGEIRTGPQLKWYISDGTKLYAACSEDQRDRIVRGLYEQRFYEHPTPVSDLITPSLVFPLEVDGQWSAFYDIAPNADYFYVWHVEAVVDLVTSAGTFEDCYRIALYTNPDTSLRYVCPGLGTAAYEYHHNGSLLDFRIELSSYRPEPPLTGATPTPVTSYAPAILEVHTQRVQTTSGLVIYADIFFVDPDGDSDLITYEVVETTIAGITVENDALDIEPGQQRDGAIRSVMWECKGASYRVVLQATVLDRSGNQSNPYRITFDCP